MLIKFAVTYRQSGPTEDLRFVVALGKVSISKICHNKFLLLPHVPAWDLKLHDAAAFYDQVWDLIKWNSCSTVITKKCFSLALAVKMSWWAEDRRPPAAPAKFCGAADANHQLRDSKHKTHTCTQTWRPCRSPQRSIAMSTFSLGHIRMNFIIWRYYMSRYFIEVSEVLLVILCWSLHLDI